MVIDVLLFDGFDELDAVAPFEVLTSARDLGAPFDVALAGVHGDGAVTAAHGLRVLPDGAAGARRADLVVVPGGGWNTRGPLGARAEVERGVLPRRLTEWHDGGATVATVCTGALIAGAGGLLRGRPATTHHANLDDLAAMGARVTGARVVDDGDVLTAGGVTSGLDLALHLVERHASRELADRVAAEIEHERRG
jgi:transcriptional regulator GlxA family with amidase domain